jgi:hypothetical protein
MTLEASVHAFRLRAIARAQAWATSATAEPDIPAKITLPTTFTWARPPRSHPTRDSAKA